MRDMLPNKTPLTDPHTGSNLVYTAAGREGCFYRFEYRKKPSGPLIGFVVVVSTFTDFMLERYHEQRGLPKPDILRDGFKDWGRRIAEFAQAYGRFGRVEEWYLIGPDGKALAGPPEAQRTWSGFTLDEAQQIIDTFYRLYFELTARRPGATSEVPSERYYPDLLKFEPYNLPKKLIQERRAAPGGEI